MTRPTTRTDFDHGAIRLALLGMRAARVRAVSFRGITPDDVDGVGIAAVDFVNWACAVDERLRKTATDDYEKRRDQDPKGRVLPGLRFVRDRHMHQVVVSTDVDRRSFFDPPPGAIFYISAGIIWRAAAELPVPDKGYDHADRRQAYVDHMEGKTVWGSLQQALDWLTPEIMNRGVALPTEPPIRSPDH